MNAPTNKPIESCIKSYDGYVDFWTEDVGDTEQLFKLRDHIHDRLRELTPAQKADLRKTDDKLLRLVDEHQDSQEWDVLMLRKTGSLIKDERYGD